MEGIPHGGCYWKDCKECFPPGTPYPKSWEDEMAVESTTIRVDAYIARNIIKAAIMMAINRERTGKSILAKELAETAFKQIIELSDY